MISEKKNIMIVRGYHIISEKRYQKKMRQVNAVSDHARCLIFDLYLKHSSSIENVLLLE